MNLTSEQRAAVDLATSRTEHLVAVTGGPGTGKTTTVRAIVSRAKAIGMRFTLLAPSGKASQRLAEATGEEASTIHRALGLRPGEEAQNMLETALVVIDEASMVDVTLMATVTKHCGLGVRTVVLVGDADQLPPVSPGAPFADLLRGGLVPSVHLTQVHRQASGSGIIQAAYDIQKGLFPRWCKDVQLITTPDAWNVPVACWSVLRQSDPHEAQALSPQHKGAAGVEAINDYVEKARLFETTAPWIAPSSAPTIGKGIRAGTKVLHTRNDYELGVYNGEIGTVVSTYKDENEKRLNEAVVQIAGSEKRYEWGRLGDLQPAWCMTVHKSQGSEWPTVVVVAHENHRLMTRALLYVALTRASERVYVVGTERAVAIAICKTHDLSRKTWLRRMAEQEVADPF